MTTMTKSSKKPNPVIKTVLAPNAPWPKPDPIPVVRPRGRQVGWRKPPKIKMDSSVLDYFAEAREEINRSKNAARHRVRDGASGRFAPNK